MDNTGKPVKVRQCQGARDSFWEAIESLGNRGEDAIAQYQARLNRLEAGHQLVCPEHFGPEGTLSDGSTFFAIKTTQGLRAYGWFSAKHPGEFWVSHFIYKNFKKCRPTDKEKVQRNWNLIERE